MMTTATIANTQINVGMGELVVSRDCDDILACIGLGSCIAMCIWDPAAKVGGVAHMLLPVSRNNDSFGSPAKYISQGVPNLINKMLKSGAQLDSIIIKMTGGARMLNIPGGNNILDIGQRNITEAKATMKRLNLPIMAEDVGGSYGRSIQFSVGSGRVLVKSLAGRVIEL